MSEAESVNPATEVTDQQVDEFFESGGSLPEAKEEAAEVAAEPAKEEPKEKYVPLGALHEERQRRKEMAAALEEVRQKNALMEQRFNQLSQKLEPPPPDVQTDAVAHFQHKISELEKQLQATGQVQQQTVEQQRQQAQIAQFDSAYREQATKFAQEREDFGDAYSHLVTSRKQKYEQAGLSPQEADARLINDERMVAHTAFQLGINPGALIYNLAMAAGYTKKEAQKAEQKMQVIAKGNQTKSLSTAGGKVDNGLTLEALAEMDDEEFSKNFEKVIRKQA